MKDGKKKRIIIGTSFEDLKNKVIQFLDSREVSYDPLSISEQIILQNRSVKDRQQHPKKKLKLAEVASGARAIIKQAQGKAVSNDEIMRRANICMSCPMLTSVGDCMSCGAAGRISRFISGIRSTFGSQVQIPNTVAKNYCEFCSCSIPLLIVTKIENMHTDPKRPERCWMNPNSPNFKKDE